MNILALTTSYPSGSGDFSGAFIHSLLGALSKRGHNVRVVAPASESCLRDHEVDGIDVRRFRYALAGRAHLLTSPAPQRPGPAGRT